MKQLFLIVTLFIVSQADAAKKYYKWTDAQGNTHYTETKPLNKKVAEVKVNTSRVVISTKEDEDVTNSDNEKTQEQKDIDAYNEKEEELVKKTQDKENCKIARNNLATLQQTIRVKRVNPATGELIRMDDTQRINAMKQMKKNIKKLCK